MLKYLLLIPLFCFPLNSCKTAEQKIAQLDEQEFNRFENYVTRIAGVTTNLLLKKDKITITEANMIASVVRNVATMPVSENAISLLETHLVEHGFSDDETILAILLVEDLVLSRGGFQRVIGPDGKLYISPRGQLLLNNVADKIWDVTDRFNQN